MVYEPMSSHGTTDSATPRLVELPGDLDQHRWATQLAALGATSDTSPRLQSLALEALAQIQAMLQTNTKLVQQSAALEDRVQALLVERIALVEQISILEEQLAQLCQGSAGVPLPRQAIPFRPLASLPAILHQERLEVIARPSHSTTPPPLASAVGRFSRPVVSDEETLLSGTPAGPTPALAGEPERQEEGSAPLITITPPLRDYVLVAQPFARFTDLGGFQAAVQALPGVHNVRVRRFAQGTLEMRVDYDGDAPLADLLRGLALPVEEIVQEGPTRLHIRLAPLNERGFPTLS